MGLPERESQHELLVLSDKFASGGFFSSELAK